MALDRVASSRRGRSGERGRIEESSWMGGSTYTPVRASDFGVDYAGAENQKEDVEDVVVELHDSLYFQIWFLLRGLISMIGDERLNEH